MPVGTGAAAPDVALDGIGPSAPGRARPGAAPAWTARLFGVLPRTETVILLVSWLGTVAAKAVIARPHVSDGLLHEVARAAVADLFFFAGLGCVLAAASWAYPGRLVARASIFIACIAAAWSVLNAGWLFSTGAQIQPSVIRAALLDLRETQLILGDVLVANGPRILAPVLVIIAFGGWTLLRLLRPAPFHPARRRRATRAGAFAVLLGGAVALQVSGSAPAATTVWGESIGFSSHWHALRTIVGSIEPGRVARPGRDIPATGTRDLAPPAASKPRPNVVLIMLESVSHGATSLGAPAPGRRPIETPVLARLAAEGVEIGPTYCPVPHTTKAFWAALTGVTPDLRSDAVESVLVDRPYESLATILGRDGYTSSFFQMARGPWEGVPGLFANLGFDWAWFRENLEDPGAHLGWTSGDDYRMLDPMFDWVDAQPGPFLLGAITTVSHDPYVLPSWVGIEPAAGPYGRYAQTVEFGDRFVGEVIDRLAARGILDDSLIIVMGDHGEGFRPESRRGRWIGFEEVVRIPWVMRWPGRLPAGEVIDVTASQMDLTPTVLGLLGWDITRAGFDGLDALGAVPADRRLFFFSWYARSPSGFVQGRTKYLHMPAPGSVLRFDLAADPDERAPTEVSGAERAMVMAELGAWFDANRIEFPPNRSRERIVYRHWRTISTGRAASAYYLRDPPEAE